MQIKPLFKQMQTFLPPLTAEGWLQGRRRRKAALSALGRQAARRGAAGLQPVTVHTLMLQKLILQSSTLRTPLCPRIPQPGRLAV